MNSFFDNPSLRPLLLLVGRALLSVMFIIGGFGKIGGYAGTAAYMTANGVPSILLPLVIVTELGGGLALLAGWQTRLVAFLLAGFTVLASLIFHIDWSAPMQMQNFLKNMAVAGGFLVLMSTGAGRYSVDAARSAP